MATRIVSAFVYKREIEYCEFMIAEHKKTLAFFEMYPKSGAYIRAKKELDKIEKRLSEAPQKYIIE